MKLCLTTDDNCEVVTDDYDDNCLFFITDQPLPHWVDNKWSHDPLQSSKITFLEDLEDEDRVDDNDGDGVLSRVRKWRK